MMIMMMMMMMMMTKRRRIGSGERTTVGNGGIETSSEQRSKNTALSAASKPEIHNQGTQVSHVRF